MMLWYNVIDYCVMRQYKQYDTMWQIKVLWYNKNKWNNMNENFMISWYEWWCYEIITNVDDMIQFYNKINEYNDNNLFF